MTQRTRGRLEELALRRAELQARCAQQRLELGAQVRAIEEGLGRIDRTVAVVRKVVKSPLLVGIGVAAITLIGPSRILRWVSRATMWYPLVRRVAGGILGRRSARAGQLAR